jgi:predicted O-methyltransferase YrrM
MLSDAAIFAKFPTTRRTDVAPTAIAWNGIIGFLRRQEFAVLYRTAYAAPKGAQFLEIGSFFGLSSAITATAFRDAANATAQLHCVDLWEDYFGASLAAFESNCRKAGAQAHVVAHRRSSQTVGQAFAPHTFDVAFIDGDHSYEGCLSDLRAVLPLVKPGGKIIGHDYASYSQPVIRAVRDFCAGAPHVRFVAPEAQSSIFTLFV